ncbi:MAG TPA: DUF2130 domain-containing protein, partial [Sutterella sp.]|nr:DUF2130 domain-containing protein [Sutterella sp.]
MPEIKCPNCGTVFTVDKSDYAEIVDQIRNAEFEKALADRLGSALETERAKTQAQEAQMRAAHENELTRIKAELEQVRQEKESEVTRSTASLRVEIESLKGQLQQAKSEKELAVQDEHSKALVAINELQNKLNLADTEREAALASLKLEQNTALEAKNQEITDAKNSLLLLKSDHEIQLRAKDQEIAFYKDLKARMSTKMVGETLEEHCRIEFDRIRMTAFPRAYFEKDNDAKTGSKGDFIFKDFTDDGIPFISIMFEMKNEMETTATKHRNEDFFKELDKDRREKGCEYAVLVSMLEADNDLYNAGIVDVSYRYEKMYVVRPQCFLAIITLLRNAA